MDKRKFTQKSLEVIRLAEKIALENGDTHIEPEHILYALINLENGTANRLFEKNRHRRRSGVAAHR